MLKCTNLKKTKQHMKKLAKVQIKKFKSFQRKLGRWKNKICAKLYETHCKMKK